MQQLDVDHHCLHAFATGETLTWTGLEHALRCLEGVPHHRFQDWSDRRVRSHPVTADHLAQPPLLDHRALRGSMALTLLVLSKDGKAEGLQS